KQDGLPAPGIGAGSIVFLVFFILFGLSVSSAHRVMSKANWDAVGDEVDIDGFDVGNIFGQKFEYTQNLEEALPPGASLSVVADRGDIRVTPGTDDKVHVAIRKVIRADSQEEANNKNTRVAPSISVAGTVVSIDAMHKNSDWDGVTTDMEIT